MTATTFVALAHAAPTGNTAQYDLSGMYRTVQTALAVRTVGSAPVATAENELERLRTENRELQAFVAQHCRPAASAITAYAEYLLANDGETLGTAQRQIVGLIHGAARTVMADSGVVARRAHADLARLSS